jgi:hypothetical protein
VPKQELATPDHMANYQFEPKGFEGWAEQASPLEPLGSLYLGQPFYPNYQGNLIKWRQEIIMSTYRNLLTQPHTFSNFDTHMRQNDF